MNLLNFKNKKVRVLYPLLLLVIPLIGMCITEEINWSPFDFIIMGVLILSVSIGINFTLNKTKNLKNRIIYIGILGFLFLLIWAELAVGIFGSPFAGN
jgi:uncharacterized membrane protein AbrB (regulator of aidB expression)